MSFLQKAQRRFSQPRFSLAITRKPGKHCRDCTQVEFYADHEESVTVCEFSIALQSYEKETKTENKTKRRKEKEKRRVVVDIN